jgi:hypothetical protein
MRRTVGRPYRAIEASMSSSTKPMPRHPTRPETSARSFKEKGLISVGAPG